MGVSANSRLTVAAHALVWMARHELAGHDCATSNQIAGSVPDQPSGGPAAARRPATGRPGRARDRDRPPVGGWPGGQSRSTLLDVNEALGGGSAFALHQSPPSRVCPVARSIGPALTGVYEEVDRATRDRLARTSVDQLLAPALAEESRPAAAFTSRAPAMTRCRRRPTRAWRPHRLCHVDLDSVSIDVTEAAPTQRLTRSTIGCRWSPPTSPASPRPRAP